MKRSAMQRSTPLASTLPMLKRCSVCPKEFAPARPMQRVCSPRCASAEVRKGKQAEKALTRSRREALMTHGDWIAAVQVHFNRYIRLRDAGLPCICCGKPMEPDRPGGAVDAGHYRSRGSSPHLRFDERNVHAQRKSCNRPGGTTAASFRAGMVARIGLAAVEQLEADQMPRKYTVADLKELHAHYRAKCREFGQRDPQPQAAA